jgi:hypothetical protein
MWWTKALHCFSEEFQCCTTIPALGDVTFKHLALVIYGAPQVVRFTVDLHKNFVQMPLPIRMSAKVLNAANNGPKRFHQNRTVSWLISIPRSCRRSSTFRSDRGYRTYIITARRMIAGLVLKYLNGSRFIIRRR